MITLNAVPWMVAALAASLHLLSRRVTTENADRQVLSSCVAQQRWRRTLSLFSTCGLRDVVTHATAIAACEVGFRLVTCFAACVYHAWHRTAHSTGCRTESVGRCGQAASVLSHLDRAGLAASLNSFIKAGAEKIHLADAHIASGDVLRKLERGEPRLLLQLPSGSSLNQLC